MNEAIQYHTELFNQTIGNFEKMYEAGQIDEDEYNQYLTSAYLELQQRIASELGIEEEDVEELISANYSDSSDTAEFSVGNRFGAAILELGEAAGYEDLEQLCVDLGEATNVSPENIYELITGESVPDNELALEISDVFGLTDDYQADMLIAGIEARGEDVNDYLDDDSEYDLDDENEEYEEENYSRVNELESKVAEFERSTIIKDRLAELSSKAYHLVEAGQMPPIAAELVIGNFSLDSDRMAAFSTVCARNQVDAATELYAMEKTLEIFERMPAIEFGYYANDVLTDQEIEEEKDLDAIAANYVKNLRKG